MTAGWGSIKPEISGFLSSNKFGSNGGDFVASGQGGGWARGIDALSGIWNGIQDKEGQEEQLVASLEAAKMKPTQFQRPQIAYIPTNNQGNMYSSIDGNSLYNRLAGL